MYKSSINDCIFFKHKLASFLRQNISIFLWKNISIFFKHKLAFFLQFKTSRIFKLIDRMKRILSRNGLCLIKTRDFPIETWMYVFFLNECMMWMKITLQQWLKHYSNSFEVELHGQPSFNHSLKIWWELNWLTDDWGIVSKTDYLIWQLVDWFIKLRVYKVRSAVPFFDKLAEVNSFKKIIFFFLQTVFSHCQLILLFVSFLHQL